MDQVRTIEAGAPPARFARGWHCLGLASRFRDGGPHAVAAFGTKLVVFADSSGALHVLDSYCRHMGGDLSQGTVKGDAIACPFHDWRWGGDGRCASIPYARRVPVAARTRAWRTLERNGHLFVWNDPEGNPPPDDVTIPLIEGASSDQWTSWTWDSILVEGANCREVIDNVVDMAHFFYIHFAFPTFFKNVFEGHIASQYLRTRSRPDVGPETGRASNYSDGSGSENASKLAISRGWPSSVTTKSSAVSPGTGWPALSTTTASTVMRSSCDGKLGRFFHRPHRFKYRRSRDRHRHGAAFAQHRAHNPWYSRRRQGHRQRRHQHHHIYVDRHRHGGRDRCAGEGTADFDWRIGGMGRRKVFHDQAGPTVA